MNYLEAYMQRMISYMDFRPETFIRPDMPVCHITKGYFAYKNLNMCFVNDMVARMAEALYQGYMPVVEVPGGEGIPNLWSAFFKQPAEFLGVDIDSVNREHIYEVEPVWGPGYKANLIPRELVCATNLYRGLVYPNDTTAAYIDNEAESILGNKQVLGILVRGTDLGRDHPAGHPVQPEPERVLEDVAVEFSAGGYDAIYLATEEESLEKLFVDRFGREHILANARHYMTKLYDEARKTHDVIGLRDVMVDNGVDLYTYGMEYLSSIYLLSRCRSLIAGNTLGSSAALFLNDRKYAKYTLYDLGFYGE